MALNKQMTPGGSTKMPSVNISLPLHVTAKPRQDGTYNVLFRVRRNRPQDWPSTIPLPLTGRRTGKLDPDELARIERDVNGTEAEQFQDGLLWKLKRAQDGAAGVTAFPDESLPAIAALWEVSWEKAKPPIRARTQEFYRKELRILKAWSATNKHKPMRHLDLPGIMKLLVTYDDRPAQRSALRRTLSALFSFAMITGAGNVKTHPFGVTPRLRRQGRKRKVGLWDQAAVDAYADKAPLLAKPWPGGRRLIKLMWETSADATDVVTWRRDKHFRDSDQPAILYTRGKTNEDAAIPISHALAKELRECGSIFFVTDPDGRPYAEDDVKADNTRGWHFRLLRGAVVADGGPELLLDHLRHSAITDALEKGATREHVPSLSAHRGTQMVDQIYSQMTENQAAAVQRARKIID